MTTDGSDYLNPSDDEQREASSKPFDGTPEMEFRSEYVTRGLVGLAGDAGIGASHWHDGHTMENVVIGFQQGRSRCSCGPAEVHSYHHRTGHTGVRLEFTAPPEVGEEAIPQMLAQLVAAGQELGFEPLGWSITG